MLWRVLSGNSPQRPIYPVQGELGFDPNLGGYHIIIKTAAPMRAEIVFAGVARDLCSLHNGNELSHQPVMRIHSLEQCGIKRCGGRDEDRQYRKDEIMSLPFFMSCRRWLKEPPV